MKERAFPDLVLYTHSLHTVNVKIVGARFEEDHLDVQIIFELIFAQCTACKTLESSNTWRHGCASLQHFRYSSGAFGGSVDSKQELHG